MILFLLNTLFITQISYASEICVLNQEVDASKFTSARQTAEKDSIQDTRSWNPLRIYFEFVDLPDDQSLTMITNMQNIAKVFLQKHLLVRRPIKSISVPSTIQKDLQSYDLEFPDSLLNNTYDTDLVFFIFSEYNTTEDYLAWAFPAYIDVLSNRPIIGVISWNLYYLNLTDTSNSYFESRVAILLHEIIHGLGFTPVMFKYYYDSPTGEYYEILGYIAQQGTYNVTLLSFPRVLAYAQKFYGCSSLIGVPLEQQGGSGSAAAHWERAILYNEIMTASDMADNFVITDFTLQLLQDTGFYRLATYTPDILTWGEDQGCEFIEKRCYNSTFEEFCDVTFEFGCSITHGGIGMCYSDDFSDNCKYYRLTEKNDCRNADNSNLESLYNSYDNYYGYDSMCLQGGFTKSSPTNNIPFTCNQYVCTGNNQLQIIINGQSVNCSDSANVTLSGYNGYIVCPSDTERFCQNTDECPNQCNKRGFCMKGTCTCMGQYYGIGCEKEGCLNFKNGIDCVPSCPTSTYINSDINYCIGCPGNCKTCSNYNSCTECQDGYQLREGFCDYLNAKILSFMISLILIGLLI